MIDPTIPPLDYGRRTARHLIRVPPWAAWPAILCVVVALLYAATPSTNGSRERARQRACASNLRQIGWALRAYCRDHGGDYPDSLATLVRTGPSLSPETLICPDDEDATPATGATRAAVADALAAGGHCSYTYLGRGLTATTATAATVVVYEPSTPIDRHQNGCNLLWGDGCADWCGITDAAKVLPAGTVVPWVRAPPGRPSPGDLQIR